MAYIVYLQKPSSWSSAYCFCYSSVDGTVNNAPWHGVQMSDLGNCLYSCSIPDSLGVNPFVVFNDGSNLQYPSSGGLAVTSYQMILDGTTWSNYSVSTVTVSTASIENYYVGTNGLLFVNDVLLFGLIIMFAFFLALNQFFRRA